MSEDISIYIGAENANENLKNFSIITFNHKVKGKSIGTIGIIGPKRMDYAKVYGLIVRTRKWIRWILYIF